MKYTFSFILLFYSSIACSQTNVITGDSLIEYSYTIASFNPSTAASNFGTCFFLKNKDKLFLITAQHNIYKCDSATSTLQSPYQFSAIYLLKSNELLTVKFPQKIPVECKGMDKDTDLLVIPVDTSWCRKIKSVNDFLLPPFQQLGDCIIYGQGMKSTTDYAGFEKPHRFHIPTDSFKVYTNAPTEDTTHIDTVKYFIQSFGPIITSAMKGFSGSPVFLQDRETKLWRLAGVFVIAFTGPTEVDNGGLGVVKTEYIFHRTGIPGFIQPTVSPQKIK